MKERFKESDILSYSKSPHARTTVRRYYSRWRKRNRIPDRCDISECVFYTNPLEWNGKTLPLVLDHVNGNRNDNTTKNLRYLCPNCNAQQPTHGGKNIGRIQNETEIGYEIVHGDGLRDANILPKPINFNVHVNEMTTTTD